MNTFFWQEAIESFSHPLLAKCWPSDWLQSNVQLLWLTARLFAQSRFLIFVQLYRINFRKVFKSNQIPWFCSIKQNKSKPSDGQRKFQVFYCCLPKLPNNNIFCLIISIQVCLAICSRTIMALDYHQWQFHDSKRRFNITNKITKTL